MHSLSARFTPCFAFAAAKGVGSIEIEKMSVADEIMKLHQLMQQGILTAEEFHAAKQGVLQRGAAAPVAASKDASPSAALQTRDVSGRIDTSFFEESHTGAHAQAYSHMKKIVQNILRAPGEPRFRRLRMENPTLQNELFSNPGSEPFLKSLGFVFESVVLAEGRTEDIMIMRDPTVDLQAALSAVEALELRDAAAAEAAVALGKLRRSVGLEVRRERWVAAQAAGELEPYILKSFLADTAGDMLFSALESIDTLLDVTENILANPGEGKFRRLKLSNRRVRRAVFDQNGGLEYLVAVLGFELGTDSVALPSNSAALVGDEKERLEGGRSMLISLRNDVHQTRVNLLARQREEATRSALEEMAAARRQAAKKQQEDSSGVAHVAGSGKRVPLQEALQQLLGRNLEAQD
jgi:hypothetical protein